MTDCARCGCDADPQRTALIDYTRKLEKTADELATTLQHTANGKLCDGLDCFVDEPESALREYNAVRGVK